MGVRELWQRMTQPIYERPPNAIFASPETSRLYGPVSVPVYGTAPFKSGAPGPALTDLESKMRPRNTTLPFKKGFYEKGYDTLLPDKASLPPVQSMVGRVDPVNSRDFDW